jgi:hypothetical protein
VNGGTGADAAQNTLLAGQAAGHGEAIFASLATAARHHQGQAFALRPLWWDAGTLADLAAWKAQRLSHAAHGASLAADSTCPKRATPETPGLSLYLLPFVGQFCKPVHQFLIRRMQPVPFLLNAIPISAVIAFVCGEFVHSAENERNFG